jgi:hypothetical protein
VLGGAAEDCTFSRVFRAAGLSSVNQGRIQASPGASGVELITDTTDLSDTNYLGSKGIYGDACRREESSCPKRAADSHNVVPNILEAISNQLGTCRVDGVPVTQARAVSSALRAPSVILPHFVGNFSEGKTYGNSVTSFD